MHIRSGILCCVIALLSGPAALAEPLVAPTQPPPVVVNIPPQIETVQRSLAADWERYFAEFGPVTNDVVIRVNRIGQEREYNNIIELRARGSLVLLIQAMPGNRRLRILLPAADILEMRENFRRPPGSLPD